RRILAKGELLRARLLVGGALGLVAAAAVAGPLGQHWAGSIGGILALLLLTLLHGIVAEIFAAASLQRPDRALRTLAILRPLEVLLTPLAYPLVFAGRLTQRWLLPLREDDPERMAALAVEHVIDEGEEAGSIAEDQANLLRSVLEFRETVAREVMVPRTQLTALELGASLHEVLPSVVESGHSRYPVYRENLDQIEGVLYAKDVFRVIREGGDLGQVSLGSLIRKPAFFLPEGQRIGAVLRDMQARRYHLAVVVDEFGGTSGIVTLEDILEEIVGEIQDEHDEETNPVVEVEPGRYLVDAGVSVHDLEEILGEPLHVDTGGYDSLGGLLAEIAGRVPSPGEQILSGKFEITVIEGDDRRVSRVELCRRAAD
ncbi:MAG: hemolysin family protein, partial [Myxococcales bacterium]|nr:hemolysin family protein [Myxococcales bacterium]